MGSGIRAALLIVAAASAGACGSATQITYEVAPGERSSSAEYASADGSTVTLEWTLSAASLIVPSDEWHDLGLALGNCSVAGYRCGDLYVGPVIVPQAWPPREGLHDLGNGYSAIITQVDEARYRVRSARGVDGAVVTIVYNRCSGVSEIVSEDPEGAFPGYAKILPLKLTSPRGLYAAPDC